MYEAKVPFPNNEGVLDYEPGSKDIVVLKTELEKQLSHIVEIPVVIQGKRVWTKQKQALVSPHQHEKVLAYASYASSQDLQTAVNQASDTQREWNQCHWRDRVAVFLRAAELLSTHYRAKVNAATMLAQSKTCYQAEIDAVCELVDFLRFNAYFAEAIYSEQPLHSPRGIWNQSRGRGLEGFVAAIGPFNFTSISVNLATAPALMGCSVLWKPAPQAVLASYYCYLLLEEAGLPAGVIQFVPALPNDFESSVLKDQRLAGVHFTGSTRTFNHLWQVVAQDIGRYRNYPRIVGETGGKDFVLAHNSCDPEALKTALIRGAFEFQGQKCSAASRAYIPESIWSLMGESLLEEVCSIRMGDPYDFSYFMGAVIDRAAFNKIKGYIDHAKKSPDVERVVGGDCDDSVGYYISPAVILVKDPTYRSMCEEIFGPVLSIYVYPDSSFSEVVKLCDSSTPYGLTGAIFARETKVIQELSEQLQYAAGNFYINDKPTGAVVGQQPFGGGRHSGTNDKAGSKLNLLRWMSQQTIKETFTPSRDYRYPHML